MNIAFAYESVMPARGGCETYIADLARRLRNDRHDVHLYASRWDEEALPKGIVYHAIPAMRGPRFLRPWRFGWRVLREMQKNSHDVTLGFDKTWGQDVLYPQGGLHVASAEHNLLKFRSTGTRKLVRLLKTFDLAAWSFRRLEARQYLGPRRPLVVVNSHMVRDHFRQHYAIPAEDLYVVRSSIDPDRFPEHDRLKRRQEFRLKWKINPGEVVGLMAAMNYRLKGLDPLLHAFRTLLQRPEFRDNPPPLRLVIAGSPQLKRYATLATKLELADKVTFIGPCREMKNAYFASDFLVHPTFYDPCSLVVLEALACGLPIITSRYNGASELMHPLQEGYVVDDPHDDEHLAWCMLQLLDPARRQACAQAARKTASHWTFENHYRQLLSVFAEAMARKEVA
jgi:UDP-glucose:(heptosyl)LPS alpha-1,3-glucosyltransferase